MFIKTHVKHIRMRGRNRRSQGVRSKVFIAVPVTPWLNVTRYIYTFDVNTYELILIINKQNKKLQINYQKGLDIYVS